MERVKKERLEKERVDKERPERQTLNIERKDFLLGMGRLKWIV